ncbi:MAG: hypothetical protein ABEK59_12170 [Halobacteria archaeon]
MSTSVKMDRETKSRLEELQAKIKLETGKKVSQEDLLEKIVDHAVSSEDEIVDSFRDNELPLTEEESEEFHEGTELWGGDIEEDDIDDVIYGDL